MPAFLHTVHFWLKDDLNEEDKHHVLEGIRSLADSPKSVITRQVTNGVAVRMAVLERVCQGMTEH